MFLKLPKTRQFTYRPKFYKPPEVKEEDGPRIKFRRYRPVQTAKRKPVLVMVVLVIILISLLCYWQKVERSEKKDFKFENITIEEIQ